MGLAKSATEVAQEKLKQLQTPVSDGITSGESIEKIPSEVYSYFNINPQDSKEEVTKIVSWAKEEAKTPAEILNKINNLEIKLGQPRADETRISKMHNWVRMTQNIKDVDQSYKQELNGIKTSHKKTLDEIDKSRGEEVKKLSTQIQRIEEKYNNVYHATRARTMEEMTRIKREYEAQLNELKALRKVYQGRK